MLEMYNAVLYVHIQYTCLGSEVLRLCLKVLPPAARDLKKLLIILQSK